MVALFVRVPYAHHVLFNTTASYCTSTSIMFSKHFKYTFKVLTVRYQLGDPVQHLYFSCPHPTNVNRSSSCTPRLFAKPISTLETRTPEPDLACREVRYEFGFVWLIGSIEMLVASGSSNDERKALQTGRYHDVAHCEPSCRLNSAMAS